MVARGEGAQRNSWLELESYNNSSLDHPIQFETPSCDQSLPFLR